MPAARKKSAATRTERRDPPALAVVPSGDRNASPAAHEMPLADGATVRVTGGATAEILDREGRLLLRYRDGHAEIAAPAGDLRLVAGGRVVIAAGTDVAIDAPRDVDLTAGQSARIDARRAEIRAAEARVTGGDVTIAAERFFAKVRVLAQHADRVEVSAGRILERAREVCRDVEDLVQTRAGRLRTVVEDALHLQAKRTSITSKEDTSIDGKKVLLG